MDQTAEQFWPNWADEKLQTVTATWSCGSCEVNVPSVSLSRKCANIVLDRQWRRSKSQRNFYGAALQCLYHGGTPPRFCWVTITWDDEVVIISNKMKIWPIWQVCQPITIASQSNPLREISRTTEKIELSNFAMTLQHYYVIVSTQCWHFSRKMSLSCVCVCVCVCYSGPVSADLWYSSIFRLKHVRRWSAWHSVASSSLHILKWSCQYWHSDSLCACAVGTRNNSW